ncbi:hypothetical protein DUNSADRAFT_18746 [Dunaliella salina]|uniref:Uncharacterized protein n=1 Tax=Dunaliella salina TaxID=3046 RepID=A0ABQ7GYS3_DUNSA|nr:hypothetical protein DUNSADRAFT_18746 [Dunaliella salina]|eukprot:KAF5839745.1 hypothetical protein DUNSADRAFT_18746 [Dunaliella salina]
MGQNLIEHRPAMVWLTELQKAKAEGGTTTKPKITVQDLLERINDPNAPEQALIPTSPRSVQACFRLGVDPVDLQEGSESFRVRSFVVLEVIDRSVPHVSVLKMRLSRMYEDLEGHFGGQGHEQLSMPEKKGPDSILCIGKSKKRTRMRGDHFFRCCVLHACSYTPFFYPVYTGCKQKEDADEEFHPVHWYKQKEDADEEVTRLRYERYEAVRQEGLRLLIEEPEHLINKIWQERLRLLIEERKHLINENWQANTDPRAMLRRNDSGADPRSSSAMVEKERQRLEVLKRRQEKELQQMVQYEITRKELLDKQQKRVEEQERRAMEQAQLKIQHEAARMAKQREIELQRMAEEKEMERRARVLAEETYRSYRTKLSKTWLIHAREEAHKKEEEHRKHLERLDKYAAALETEEMCKLSVKERAAEKERLLAELNARRRGGHMSITLNLMLHVALHHQRCIRASPKDARCRGEHEGEGSREEGLLAELNASSEYGASFQCVNAKNTNTCCRSVSKCSGAIKREPTSAAAARRVGKILRRKKENDLKKVDSDFQLKLRLDKVDCIQKMSLYNRQQLLERIMHDYDKTRELLKERQDLQTQRKMANMNASLQRQMMSKAMDSLRFTKNVGSLSSGGSVNINDLLSRTRPSTAL